MLESELASIVGGICVVAITMASVAAADNVGSLPLSRHRRSPAGGGGGGHEQGGYGHQHYKPSSNNLTR